ncbi:MAG TPA: lysoplasmalogenase family protein, partial [Cyclobacteriaceae bacterium]|nr:lysoplasmalogenase family protein [Cyclobacteriaceae bacterium]
MHKHKFIFAAFLLVVGTHLFNQFHGNVFLHQLSKLLILPLLILYYFRASKLGGNAISFMVILALFFSFLGDTLLMYVHIAESYFLAGLVAFLLAHVAYIFVYRQFRHADAANALQGVRRVRMAFPIVLAGSGLVFVLYP